MRNLFSIFHARIATFVALALIVLQSLLPLTGELLAQRGWISSLGMQVICTATGVKFVKTDELGAQSEASDGSHTVKCPWCQLGEPVVLPRTAAFFAQASVPLATLSESPRQAEQPQRWRLLPARAPPSLVL